MSKYEVPPDELDGVCEILDDTIDEWVNALEDGLRRAMGLRTFEPGDRLDLSTVSQYHGVPDPRLQAVLEATGRQMWFRVQSSVKNAAAYLESPLEWIGIAYLLLVLTRRCPLAVRVHGTGFTPADADISEKERQETRLQIQKTLNAIRIGEKYDDSFFQKWVDPFSDECRRIVEALPGIPPTVHIVLQHPIQNLYGDGRGIRPDALLFIPENEKKFNFEFDGITYHSGPEAEARDQRRDIAMEKIGYRVSRYRTPVLLAGEPQSAFLQQLTDFFEEHGSRSQEEPLHE